MKNILIKNPNQCKTQLYMEIKSYNIYIKIYSIINQSKRNGQTMEDVHFIEKNFHSLDSKFEYNIVAIK